MTKFLQTITNWSSEEATENYIQELHKVQENSMFTIGSDPEFALEKDGKVYSAIGIVPGNKDARVKVNGYEFFYDNVMAECSMPPASSKKEFVKNIKGCLKKYAKLVKPYRLKLSASTLYDNDQLQDLKSLEIGCEKEFCSYRLEVVDTDVDTFKKTNLRTAGGHIHLGSEILLNGFNFHHAIRLLDLFLGTTSIFIDHDPTSQRRKAIYGRSGRYRNTSYGVEYRTPGNFWLASPKLVELVYDICEFTLKFIENGSVNNMWSIDIDRLNDREAWAEPDFHQSQCHTCQAYDVVGLRKAVDSMDKKAGEPFLAMIKKLFPKKINDAIDELCENKNYNMYSEWSL